MALITRTKLYKSPPQTQSHISLSLQHPPNDTVHGTAIITASSIHQASERERWVHQREEEKLQPEEESHSNDATEKYGCLTIVSIFIFKYTQ